jgi:hypothetical protein
MLDELLFVEKISRRSCRSVGKVLNAQVDNKQLCMGAGHLAGQCAKHEFLHAKRRYQTTHCSLLNCPKSHHAYREVCD